MENAIPTMIKKATNFGVRLFNGTTLNIFWQIKKKMQLLHASQFEALINVP